MQITVVVSENFYVSVFLEKAHHFIVLSVDLKRPSHSIFFAEDKSVPGIIVV